MKNEALCPRHEHRRIRAAAKPDLPQSSKSLPPDAPVLTTIITVGQDLSGWLPACRRAPDRQSRMQAYARLQRSQEFYRRIDCLPFDESAAAIFDQLRGMRIRVGTNDLAIAAVTLSVAGVLVTRNTVDFERIPGLTVEDWTV